VAWWKSGRTGIRGMCRQRRVVDEENSGNYPEPENGVRLGVTKL